MRRFLPLLAMFSLAFAPLPFPTKPGAKDSVAVEDLVGTWRVVAIQRTAIGGLVPTSDDFQTVTVSKTRWVFDKPLGGTGYDLHIRHATRPAEIDLHYAGQDAPHGRGLIQRRGNTLRVIYTWGKRPTSFEGQQLNCYVLTLKRP